MAEHSSFKVSEMPRATDGPERVLAVAGDVDVATSPELARSIGEVVASGSPRVTVDLSAVDFIDASGIEVLVAAVAVARTQDSAVVVRHPSPSVRRLIEILELDGALPVEPAPGEVG